MGQKNHRGVSTSGQAPNMPRAQTCRCVFPSTGAEGLETSISSPEPSRTLRSKSAFRKEPPRSKHHLQRGKMPPQRPTDGASSCETAGPPGSAATAGDAGHCGPGSSAAAHLCPGHSEPWARGQLRGDSDAHQRSPDLPWPLPSPPSPSVTRLQRTQAGQPHKIPRSSPPASAETPQQKSPLPTSPEPSQNLLKFSKNPSMDRLLEGTS